MKKFSTQFSILLLRFPPLSVIASLPLCQFSLSKRTSSTLITSFRSFPFSFSYLFLRFDQEWYPILFMRYHSPSPVFAPPHIFRALLVLLSSFVVDLEVEGRKRKCFGYWMSRDKVNGNSNIYFQCFLSFLSFLWSTLRFICLWRIGTKK